MFEYLSNCGDMSPDAAGARAADELKLRGFSVAHLDNMKPWGVEIRVAEEVAAEWMATFFQNEDLPDDLVNHPHGPNIMLLAPHKRLSWHVHERKYAHLKVVVGPVLATLSETDDEAEPRIVEANTYIRVPELIRHRLGALSTWAVVAEISRNVFTDNPTDPSDTRRISDDYGR